MTVNELKEKVLNDSPITKEEALFLINEDIEEVACAADEIRKKYNGNSFDMCAIMSVKGGRCSENCKFCAQSSCSSAEIPEYKVRDTDYVVTDAKKRNKTGITHYCQVSSGRKVNAKELSQICENVKGIVSETNLIPCVSLGLLTKEDLEELKKAGVKRVHNNIETSPKYFGKLCTTHTTDEKIKVMKLVHEAGLELCSGGIFGVGESWEDRIEMAFALREVNPESVPINMLKPIKGTPMESYPYLSEDELRRIIAVFKFILPKSEIRFAAGRDIIEDAGISFFKSGSNATISGDMLTVKGVSLEKDLENIRSLGYEIAQ